MNVLNYVLGEIEIDRNTMTVKGCVHFSTLNSNQNFFKISKKVQRAGETRICRDYSRATRPVEARSQTPKCSEPLADKYNGKFEDRHGSSLRFLELQPFQGRI